MTRITLGIAALLLGNGLVASSLTFERAIPLPGVEGRIDHFSYDAAGQRLFVAALGNNTVEVVDLKAGKVARSITGLAEPQGVFFVDELNQLYVANGGDGTLRAFDGSTFAPGATVKFDDDADNVRYDGSAQRLYVGHGRGALGVIDLVNNRIVAEVSLAAHPESFQLEMNGARAFVNVPGAHHIAVVDRQKQVVIATWSLGLAAANFPMALVEADHGLMVASRTPARLIVFDTESGKEVGRLELHGDCDDLFYDQARRQVYASCGEGFIDVFLKTDTGQWRLKESIKTEDRARTCFFDSGHLYLAVPKRGGRSAEIRCYRIEN